jgi:hypothetical protein
MNRLLNHRYSGFLFQPPSTTPDVMQVAAIRELNGPEESVEGKK